MNIVCMGGPVAAAEKVASAVALHGLDPAESRRLHVGFAAGRFAFMNEASGVVPRDAAERRAWPALRGKVFEEAAEVFVRLLRGDTLSSDDIRATELRREDFWVQVRCTSCDQRFDVPYALRDRARCRRCGSEHTEWTDQAWQTASPDGEEVLRFAPRWAYERLKIVPSEWRRELVQLVIGSHDPRVQTLVNQWAPVRVFNLSITSPQVIEATHERMAGAYHADGGPWKRSYMPRTTFVFLNERPGLTPAERSVAAREEAQAALAAYWTALEGTLDPNKVAAATTNALVGNADEVAAQIRERFHPDDRLMLWFDFFNHDNERVIANMEDFVREVIPRLEAP